MPHINPAWILSLLIAAVPLPGAAQDAGAARIDAYLKRLEPAGFSGQVLLARGDTLLLRGAYGWADRARGLRLTTETPVGIASASKQLTAAALLKLAEEGRLTLDDPLGRYFPDAPADKAGITLRQVLTHTAGIRGGFTEDFDRHTLEATVERLLSAPLRFEPGAGWRYASDAYNLLAAVIGKVAGEPFEAYMQRALFEPAGMADTRYGPRSRREAAGEPAVARAYVGWADRGSPDVWPVNWRVFGSGDVFTTADDLYAWHRAVGAGSIFSSEAAARYLAPLQPLPDGEVSYGFGLFHDANHAGGILEHGGDTELGYNATFIRYPAHDAVLIVVSNAALPSGFSTRHLVGGALERALLGDSLTLPPALEPLPADELALLAGSYPLTGGGTLELVSDGALLWAAGTGAAGVELLAAEPLDGAARQRAEARTAALIDALMDGDSAAYRTALEPDGVRFLDDYVEEWRELINRRGPLHYYEIVGTMASDSAALTFVRLHFRGSEATMRFRWLDLARGRLSGTDIAAPAYPVAHAVGRVAPGEWLVYDARGDRSVIRFTREANGRLRITPAAGGETRVSEPVRRIGARR